MTTTSTATSNRGTNAPPGPPGAHAANPRVTPERDPKRWWGLLVIALAQLMVVLDMTIVNIALPHTQADLGISDANRQWMITAYTLAFGGLLLLGGRVSDLLGRKRAFLIGLAGFGIASAVGGAAVNSGMLFSSRAVQGVFAAILAPAALSLLTTTFSDPKERAKAFGVYGAIAGGGSAIGLLAGGALTEYFNWRWTMYVNVPIAIIAAIGAIFLLRKAPSKPASRKLDIPGVILGSGGLVALVYGFTEAESRDWSDPLVLGLLIGAVVLLVGFALVERKTKEPLLPLHVVTDRNRAGAFLSVGLSTIAMFGLFLFLTYFLQVNLGYSPMRTGLAFLPMTAAIIIGSTQISGRLLPHVPPRLLMVPGSLLAAGGMVILTTLQVDSSYASTVLPAELLLGLGLGLVMMPAMSTATSGVEAKDSGVTSATVNTAQQVGGSIGTALLNTIAAGVTATYLTTHGNNPLEIAKGTVHGYTVAVWWAVGILILAAAVAGSLITTSPRRKAKLAAAPAQAPTSGATTGDAVEQAPAVATSTVHGTVTGIGGDPVPEAALTLIDGAGKQVAQAVTAADGSYRFAVPAGGDHVLVTSAPAHQPEAAPLRAGGSPLELDVVLAGACTLSGVVRDTGGRQVAGALAVLADTRGEVVGTTTSDEDGRYLFDSLAPGDYTIALSQPEHQPVASAVSVLDGGTSTHDITLGANAAVSGTIRGRDESIVASARVTLVNGTGNHVASTVADTKGRYTFDGIRPGEYTVVASGYAPRADQVVLEAASLHRHDVELSHEEP